LRCGGLVVFNGGDEALGFVGGDFASAQHFQDLTAVLVHGLAPGFEVGVMCCYKMRT
jgi:hypothetical protein